MRKILCLALGHRLRLVQEFTSFSRRVKCERCGGDWGMNDDARLVIPWTPGLEQFHQDMGFVIFEPLHDERKRYSLEA